MRKAAAFAATKSQPITDGWAVAYCRLPIARTTKTEAERKHPMATETLTLHVPAIHCDGCLKTARKALEDAGAEFESGDAKAKRLVVRFDPDRLSRDDVAAALEAVGFPPDVAG